MHDLNPSFQRALQCVALWNKFWAAYWRMPSYNYIRYVMTIVVSGVEARTGRGRNEGTGGEGWGEGGGSERQEEWVRPHPLCVDGCDGY